MVHVRALTFNVGGQQHDQAWWQQTIRSEGDTGAWKEFTGDPRAFLMVATQEDPSGLLPALAAVLRAAGRVAVTGYSHGLGPLLRRRAGLLVALPEGARLRRHGRGIKQLTFWPPTKCSLLYAVEAEVRAAAPGGGPPARQLVRACFAGCHLPVNPRQTDMGLPARAAALTRTLRAARRLAGDDALLVVAGDLNFRRNAHGEDQLDWPAVAGLLQEAGGWQAVPTNSVPATCKVLRRGPCPSATGSGLPCYDPRRAPSHCDRVLVRAGAGKAVTEMSSSWFQGAGTHESDHLAVAATLRIRQHQQPVQPHALGAAQHLLQPVPHAHTSRDHYADGRQTYVLPPAARGGGSPRVGHGRLDS